MAQEPATASATSSPEPTPRAKRPRPPVAVRPSFVSQETSRELLGIDPRRFLDLLLPLCRGDVTALGKLRLVPLDVAEERLRALATAPDSTPTEQPANDDAPQTVDAVLAAIGRRRTA